MLKKFTLFITIAITGLIATAPFAVNSISFSNATTIDKKSTQILTLSIPGINCPVCPITVKKALQSVKGVSHVTVDFDAKKATVKFNPDLVKLSDLTEATKQAGYPSSLHKTK